MKTLGQAAVHASLLLLPALVVGTSLSGAFAVAAWVAATSLEGQAAASGPAEQVPVAEVVRGLGLLLTLWIVVATATNPAFWALAVGGGLLLGGRMLRTRAIAELGEGFSSALAHRGERVVTGPYAWLDHPGALGMVTMVAGTALLAGSGWGLLAMLPLVAAPSAVRALLEEQAMTATPGRPPHPVGAGSRRRSSR